MFFNNNVATERWFQSRENV